MFCPKCGVENADGAAFCSACGNALNPAPVEDVAPVTENAAETVAQTPKKDFLAPVKPLLEKVKPFLEKNKLFVFAGAGVLALVLCIVLLCSLFAGGNGYTAYKHNIKVMVEDGEVFVIYDAKKAKGTGLEAEGIDHTQTSMDGSILVLLTDEGTLAFVKGNKLTKIAEEVTGFIISVDGTGVAYVVENDDSDTLMLYNVKNKKAKKVTDWLSDDNIALSPNGDSVAYYQQKEDDEDQTLMFFKGSKSTKVTSSEVTLLGMSNNGKLIYVMGEDDEGISYLYRYNTKGDRNKIGKCDVPYVYFNEDHTQIGYYQTDDGYKTYISTNGKEGKKIASAIAAPMMPRSVEPFDGGYTATIPTDELYNKVYTCTGEKDSIWFIRKNADRSQKLVGSTRRATISEDCKLVYYIDDGELKVLTVKKGDNAADKAKVLAEDVDSYIVTSNGKKLYYTADEGLYCINAKTGKGKKTIANDDVKSQLYINDKDVVYYMMDGDAYATKNGAKGKKVVTDATSITSTANGIVYIKNDDAIFATKGAKKPAKIHSYE